MDTSNLRSSHPLLIFHMERLGYGKDYIGCFRREIKHILGLADSNSALSYDDIYHNYEKTALRPNSLLCKRYVISAIERFDLHGIYPDGNRKAPYKSASQHLCEEYQSFVEYYREVAAKQGKKPSSISTQVSNASAFFLAMQQSGKQHLADIKLDDVLTFFVAPDGKIIRNYSCKHQTAAILKACIPLNPDCGRILAYLPAFKRKRKNIQYLTADEVAKVKSVLFGDSGLALRDKAIGIIALYTGLRGCDIAGLTMDSIDWENDLLHVYQQKTEAPLTLSMAAIVGNAIYDYIKIERPEVDCEFVFISRTRPYKRIQGRGTTSRISSVIMKAAGIRQNPGDRKGFHIFRHHLATQLLGNGTPRPVVSSIVGHLSPESLDVYLSADFTHLKECAISIERFPVPQEVFAI